MAVVNEGRYFRRCNFAHRFGDKRLFALVAPWASRTARVRSMSPTSDTPGDSGLPQLSHGWLPGIGWAALSHIEPISRQRCPVLRNLSHYCSNLSREGQGYRKGSMIVRRVPVHLC